MNLLQCIMTNSSCYKNGKVVNKQTGIVVHDTGAGNPNIARYCQPYETDENYDELISIIGKNRYKNDWNHSDRDAGVHAFIGKIADESVATVQALPYDRCSWGVARGTMMIKGTPYYSDIQCTVKVGNLDKDVDGTIIKSVKLSSGGTRYYVPIKLNGTTYYCKNADGQSYNYDPNARIQFEICDDGYKDKDYFDTVMKEAQEYCAYLCIQFGFDPLTQICSHKESYLAGYGGNHGDCDGWMKVFNTNMDWFRAEVKRLVDKYEEDNKKYSVIVKYVYDDGSDVCEEQRGEYKCGESYSFVSPIIDGYTADKTSVDGTMGKEDICECVVYNKQIHTVTIKCYEMESGEELHESVNIELPHGEAFRINPPPIEGYAPNVEQIIGIADKDISYEVLYSALGVKRYILMSKDKYNGILQVVFAWISLIFCARVFASVERLGDEYALRIGPFESVDTAGAVKASLEEKGLGYNLDTIFI